MTKINTNSFCRLSTVSSAFFPDTRATIVTVRGTDNKTYIGEAKWNPSDPFDPQIGFKIALERAIAKMPKPSIIEQCGGLRNGDWVCVKTDYDGTVSWGLVCDKYIYYMIHSHNFDTVKSFGKEGRTTTSKITKVIRSNDRILTLDFVSLFIKNSFQVAKDYDIEVYTTD